MKLSERMNRDRIALLEHDRVFKFVIGTGPTIQQAIAVAVSKC